MGDEIPESTYTRVCGACGERNSPYWALCRNCWARLYSGPERTCILCGKLRDNHPSANQGHPFCDSVSRLTERQYRDLYEAEWPRAE